MSYYGGSLPPPGVFTQSHKSDKPRIQPDPPEKVKFEALACPSDSRNDSRERSF